MARARRIGVPVAAWCLVLATGMPAHAWGPVSQSAIVNAAVGVLSRDRSFPLDRLSDHVRRGGSIPEAQLKEMFPNFDLSPVETIEREMVLLQTVEGKRINAYFGYRLGILGKMVAQVTAPLTSANPAYRDKYYADVDQAISGVNILAKDRLLVDPQAYFYRVQREAATQDTTIEVDYRTGVGFGEFARGALDKDVSRSVNAVADVWYTILSGGVTGVDVARSNVRSYQLSAMEYYLKGPRTNLTEVNAALQRLREENLLDADTFKTAGDLFFEAGMNGRAMEQYRAALAQDPGRRDVIERIGMFNVEEGDRALQAGNLETAADYYRAALAADKLHPDAQRKLIEAEDKIEARDKRLREAQQNIALGHENMNTAESAALNQNYAEAITSLRKALRAYGQVTDEFPAEYEVASQALRTADQLMRNYKSDLISNAQNLSGSGFAQYARSLAGDTEDVSEQALRSMLNREYRATVQALRQQLQDSLARPTP